MTPAVKFVTDLGFPDSFAGPRVPSLEPRLEVDGPTEFPSLHPYQDGCRHVFAMLHRSEPQRGMLAAADRRGQDTGHRGGRDPLDQAGRRQVWAVPSCGSLRPRSCANRPCRAGSSSGRRSVPNARWPSAGSGQQRGRHRRRSSPPGGRHRRQAGALPGHRAATPGCGRPRWSSWTRRTPPSPRGTPVLASWDSPSTRPAGICSVSPPPRSATPTRKRPDVWSALRQPAARRGCLPVRRPVPRLQELGDAGPGRAPRPGGRSIELTATRSVQAEQLAMLSRAAEQRLAEDHDRSRRIVDEIADHARRLADAALRHLRGPRQVPRRQAQRPGDPGRSRRLDAPARRTAHSASRTSARDGSGCSPTTACSPRASTPRPPAPWSWPARRTARTSTSR